MYTNYKPEDLDRIFSTPKSVYFIGIGGISMSSLAHISKVRGNTVGGYDRTRSPLTEILEKEGIKISYELSPERIDKYDVIIYTAAIKSDNPELSYALKLDAAGKKYCVYRADYLGWLMSNYKNRIGVAGMHGKSTVTGMISAIFMEAKRDPTVVLGAVLDAIGGAYRIGSDRDFIMEACEYQDSFLSFTPNIAVVMNIELDHTDYFGGIEDIINSFRKYVSIASEGYAVANTDDKNVLRALEGYKGKLVSFGLNPDAMYTAKNISCKNGVQEFDIYKSGNLFLHAELSSAGQHIIVDSLAAAAVADICGIPADTIGSGLAAFKGVKRRMELRGKFTTDSGARVPLYDDYAHHPTEIKATISAAQMLGFKRLYVVFQPHTYSRTASLFDQFAAAFDHSEVIFTDIYAAREVNTFGVSAEKLAEKAGGKFISGLENIAAYLKATLSEGDGLIVMGAGDIINLDKLLLDPNN